MTSKLTVKAIRKAYAAVVALAPCDLEVREGEFLTLLGPSGSGKTTLLMMIAGLLEPDGGDIWIDGRRATYAPPYARDIGMVFQNYALFPHLSIFENIAFPLRMRRVAEADIRSQVARVLEIVQLPHVANRRASALSGGQQQRIALARCIVFKPSLILMDEPLGALDKKLRDQLQLEIKHLHKQIGTTILYVTHDQQEAMTMSDRICLMNQGKIEQIDAPEDLYFWPKTEFAADFLGESNIYSATTVSTGPETTSFASPMLGERPIVARGSTDAALKANVRLMVRPERLLLSGRKDAHAPDMNIVSGVIREKVFLGGSTKYFVDIGNGATIFGIELTTSPAQIPNVGEHVSVAWPINATVVLPGASGVQNT